MARAKLIALYTHPADPASFDQEYFEVHVPLVKKMPGLKQVEVTKFRGNFMGGDSPYYMMAEMYFDSMESLKAAMKSPEGQAAGANIMSFAAKNITMLTAEPIVPAEVS